jgi:hypothetical protein
VVALQGAIASCAEPSVREEVQLALWQADSWALFRAKDANRVLCKRTGLLRHLTGDDIPYLRSAVETLLLNQEVKYVELICLWATSRVSVALPAILVRSHNLVMRRSSMKRRIAVVVLTAFLTLLLLSGCGPIGYVYGHCNIGSVNGLPPHEGLPAFYGGSCGGSW